MLGTAQFGMAYGIKNDQSIPVPFTVVDQILQRCKSHDVDMLDTAILYGNAEKILGQVNTSGLDIVSKLPSLLSCAHSDELLALLETSLATVGRQSFYGLLLHRAEELLTDKGGLIAEGLRKAKDRGLIHKIGVSVYDGAELPRLFDRLDIDIVQLPYNILNQKCAIDGWDKWVRARGAEVHVRSAFLQGLLLQKPEGRASQFTPYQGILARFDAMCQSLSISAVELCWRFALTTIKADRLVFGVQSLQEFDELLALSRVPLSQDMRDLASDCEGLINPLNWSVE